VLQKISILRSRLLISLLTLPLVPCLSFAENKSHEAAALIERAKQLSDIRAEGSPPFRLKATIKIVADDGTSREGTYVEDWVSAETWRTEIAAGSFNQTEVEGQKAFHLEHFATAYRLYLPANYSLA
jgi:hypothetical protein